MENLRSLVLGMLVMALVLGTALFANQTLANRTEAPAAVRSNAPPCAEPDCIIYDISTQNVCTQVGPIDPTYDLRWTRGLSSNTPQQILGGKIIAYKLQWFNQTWSEWFVPHVNDIDVKYNTDNMTMRRWWSYFYDHAHTYIICHSGSTPTATPTPTYTPTPTVTATPTSTPTPTPFPSGLTVLAPSGLRANSTASISVPLLLSGSASGLEVRAWAVTLDYNPGVLRFLGATLDGTLSAGWEIASSSPAPGRLRLTAYGTASLSGSGPLTQLSFEVIGAPGSSTALTVSEARFNEGSPTVGTQNGDLTVNTAALGGLVRYQINQRPIPDATLLLQIAGQALSTLTASDGRYALDLSLSGPATASISKSGDLGGSLSALDAAWMAQHEVGARSLTPEQLGACDVSRNGACTSYDAAMLASHLIGQPLPGSAAGRWLFTPPQRTYPELSSYLLNEHYWGVVLGDVTANWGTSEQAVARRHSGRSAIAAPLPVGQLTDLALVLEQSPSELLGYELTIRYDPQRLRITGISQAGTGSADWAVLANTTTPGVVRVIGYGVKPPQTGWPLLKLRAVSIADGTSSTAVQVEALRLNEEPQRRGEGLIWIGDTPPTVYLPLVQRR